MQDRILRKSELLKLVPLSEVTIWRMEKAGKFPRRLQQAPRTPRFRPFWRAKGRRWGPSFGSFPPGNPRRVLRWRSVHSGEKGDSCCDFKYIYIWAQYLSSV